MENKDLLSEEEQFRELRQLLKEMPKVDAPPGFEADLMRRINSEKYAEAKPGLWERITGFLKPVPSALAVGVVAIVAFVLLVNEPGDEIIQKIDTAVQQDQVASTGTKTDDKIDNSPQFESKEQQYPSKGDAPASQLPPKVSTERGAGYSPSPTTRSTGGNNLPVTAAVASVSEESFDKKADAITGTPKPSMKGAAQGGGAISSLTSAKAIQKVADSLKAKQKDTSTNK